jgi:hypothetical protein
MEVQNAVSRLLSVHLREEKTDTCDSCEDGRISSEAASVKVRPWQESIDFVRQHYYHSRLIMETAFNIRLRRQRDPRSIS